jgi:Lar family restriction alleviation protein
MSGMTFIELEPCPFCGGECIYEGRTSADPDGKYSYYLFCTDCICQGPVENKYIDAIEKWNTRGKCAKKA